MGGKYPEKEAEVKHDDSGYRMIMYVNEKKLGCKKCSFRNGNVCNICYKKLYEEFYKERQADKNGKSIINEAEKNKGS